MCLVFHEITTLRITEQDIEAGKVSRRKPAWTDSYFLYGGAISEAYKRVFKYDDDLMVSLPTDYRRWGTMQRLDHGMCDLEDDAIDFQQRCDNSESVKPTSLMFRPYIFTPGWMITKYSNPEMYDQFYKEKYG